jgi:hypothetical protein
MKPLFSLIALSLALHPLFAKPPVAAIAEPTTLIISTPFDQPTPPTRKGPINGWQAGIGEWTVKDGALHGTELESDHHHSSCTYRLDATHLIIKAQFRLGTATQIAFGCRDTIAPNNHLARTYISPSAIWITHMSEISKTTKSEKAAELKVPIDPDAWHTLTIEIIGDHYRATIDDHVIEASHPRFKDPKGIVALINKGQDAQFKNVSLSHAQPKSSTGAK